MPRLKVEILGSQIEINYEENEYKKLLLLIENFKKRLDTFPNNGRITNNKIIFLSALKAEDEIQEYRILIQKNKADKNKIDEQKIRIDDLNNEIFNIKKKLNDLQTLEESAKNNEYLIIKEIDKLKNAMDLIYLKIKDSIK